VSTFLLEEPIHIIFHIIKIKLTAGTSILGAVKAVAEATRAATIVSFILIELVLKEDSNKYYGATWLMAEGNADCGCSSRSPAILLPFN